MIKYPKSLFRKQFSNSFSSLAMQPPTPTHPLQLSARYRSAVDRELRAAALKKQTSEKEISALRTALEVIEARQGRISWTTDEMSFSSSPPNSKHYQVVTVSVWSSIKITPPPWPLDEPTEGPALLKIHPGKHLWDYGRNGSVSCGQLLDDPTMAHAFYKSTISPNLHEHYIAIKTQDGPVVISIEKTNVKLRAMMWSRNGVTRFVIPTNLAKTEQIEAFFPQLEKVHWTVIEGRDMRKDLEEHEARELVHTYKFGVLYCRPGQSTENEFYSNNEYSPAFDEFLTMLGSRIRLAEHKGFMGGLQASGATGNHSVYTVFRDLEVMFHVAPFLPMKESDAQQLERKRHLGNDVCLIVFRDEGCTTPFDPEIISSHFNHVWIVVQPLPRPPDAPSDYRTIYKVAVTSKLGVPGFGPPLPANGLGPLGHHFHDWLLAKLINGERAAMNAPEFKNKFINTRFRYLSPLVGKYAASKTMQSLMSI